MKKYTIDPIPNVEMVKLRKIFKRGRSADTENMIPKKIVPIATVPKSLDSILNHFARLDPRK